jgi:hypothetical protein
MRIDNSLTVFGAVMSVLVVLGLWFMIALEPSSAQKPDKPPVEKAPQQQRSLEKIDALTGDFGVPDVYLFRVFSCYYVIVHSEGRNQMLHVESCPSPAHNKTLPTCVLPNGPVMGIPLQFGGVIPARKK